MLKPCMANLRMTEFDSGMESALEPIASTPVDDERELLDLLPGVRSFFRRRVTASEADDLTQEVYLHMRARSSSAVIKNLRGYLLTVAANVLNERARRDRVRKATHVAFEDTGHSAEQNTPERIVLQRDQINLMVAAIQELPARTRDVFLLHRFEEMTYNAIARKMGMSSSGVEKHIMKALRHITGRLKETNA
jgi:RNA polymerase sigma factor (sigma-70 family)